EVVVTARAAESPVVQLDVEALFKEIELDESEWDSFCVTQDFRGLDLSPIRNVVRTHNLTANQLLDAAGREGSNLAPVLILACAYAADIDRADLDRLFAIADVDASAPDPRRLAEPYAAIRALWMLSAQE